MPVHIFGMPCDMDPINAIAKKHNLAVVEDACQAWLAEYKGRKCGTIGDLGCFSFQTSKVMPIGEGGAITTDDADFKDRLYSYHNYGYGNLRDYGLADKKAAVEQLARRNPFIDVNRVGIWGLSYGGVLVAQQVADHALRAGA